MMPGALMEPCVILSSPRIAFNSVDFPDPKLLFVSNTALNIAKTQNLPSSDNVKLT